MLLLTSHRIARQTENSENWDPLVQQSESGAAHNLGSRDMCRCLFTLLPSWKRTHFMCAELIFSRIHILHTPTSPTLQQSLLFSILNVDSVEVWLDDGISSVLAQGNPRYLFIHHHFNCQCFDPEWITVDFITAPLSCELCLLFPFQPNRITRGNLQIVKSVNLSATGDWGRAIKSPTRSHSVVVSEISTTTEQKKNTAAVLFMVTIFISSVSLIPRIHGESELLHFCWHLPCIQRDRPTTAVHLPTDVSHYKCFDFWVLADTCCYLVLTPLIEFTTICVFRTS